MSSRCDSPAAISDRSRDCRSMAGGVSRYSTAARPSGGRKRKVETPTGEFGTGSTVSCSSRQAREMVNGAVDATGTRPAPPPARLLGHVNATTPDGSALGATSGVSVKIRGGLCRPQQLCEAYWGFSHGARTCPPLTHAQQPRPSDRQYRRPGPGAGARGEGRAAARARGRRGGAEQGREAGTGTLGEGRTAE